LYIRDTTFSKLLKQTKLGSENVNFCFINFLYLQISSIIDSILISFTRNLIKFIQNYNKFPIPDFFTKSTTLTIRKQKQREFSFDHKNSFKMQSQLEELVQFLDTTSRVELKSVAVTNILSKLNEGAGKLKI
jgi:hypothetical protein